MGIIDQGLNNLFNMALTELAKRADSGELSTDIENIVNGVNKFFKEDLKEIIDELKKEEVRKEIVDSIKEGYQDSKLDLHEYLNEMKDDYADFKDSCKEVGDVVKKRLK